MAEESPFHPGERLAQQRFNEDWNEDKAARLGAIFRPALDESMALFIEGLPFFFLATADASGNCDCSFRGSDPLPDGRPAPAARVEGPTRLVFPDLPGNRVFNSLGNLLENPRLGLLFLDFPARSRLRVNGRAAVGETLGEYTSLWPQAARLIRVEVEQVFWNCGKRIPSHV